MNSFIWTVDSAIGQRDRLIQYVAKATHRAPESVAAQFAEMEAEATICGRSETLRVAGLEGSLIRCERAPKPIRAARDWDEYRKLQEAAQAQRARLARIERRVFIVACAILLGALYLAT